MLGDICSSSNGLIVSFLGYPLQGGRLNLTALQRGEPGNEANDSSLCHHHGKFHGPLLHAPHQPEELCGAPLDAAQLTEELSAIDSLDLFLERFSDSLY